MEVSWLLWGGGLGRGLDLVVRFEDWGESYRVVGIVVVVESSVVVVEFGGRNGLSNCNKEDKQVSFI